MTALYVLSLVLRCGPCRFQTTFCTRPKAWLTLTIRFAISSLTLVLREIFLPLYVRKSPDFSLAPLTDVSCGEDGIGWRLMHDNCLLSVDAKSEVFTGGSEEVNAPLHFLFCRCIECAVVSGEKFVDDGCGYTRAEVHPTLFEESAIHLVGDADPGAFAAPGTSLVTGGRRSPCRLFHGVGGSHIGFREQSLLRVSVQMIEENAGVDLSGDVQQRDSSVVVAELVVPFLL
ncbi:unnamed protein product [Schistocephalus solidus]|uniref:Uncharacterized protein n=1 Tax=Schistocephalus solidus TaxID=70667 RepID=A0A183TFA5_SCHSO|nr:unnamed protein product [Schistocephalus solidus]